MKAFWLWLKDLRWHKRRSVGHSPIVRASLFMPVVGYLILLNKHTADLVKLDPRLQPLSEGHPWRLVLLYYGFVLTG